MRVGSGPDATTEKTPATHYRIRCPPPSARSSRGSVRRAGWQEALAATPGRRPRPATPRLPATGRAAPASTATSPGSLPLGSLRTVPIWPASSSPLPPGQPPRLRRRCCVVTSTSRRLWTRTASPARRGIAPAGAGCRRRACGHLVAAANAMPRRSQPAPSRATGSRLRSIPWPWPRSASSVKSQGGAPHSGGSIVGDYSSAWSRRYRKYRANFRARRVDNVKPRSSISRRSTSTASSGLAPARRARETDRLGVTYSSSTSESSARRSVGPSFRSLAGSIQLTSERVSRTTHSTSYRLLLLTTSVTLVAVAGGREDFR